MSRVFDDLVFCVFDVFTIPKNNVHEESASEVDSRHYLTFSLLSLFKSVV